MRMFIVLALAASVSLGALGCASNQPGQIVLGDGKLGNFQLCPAAALAYSLYVQYPGANPAVIAAAPSALALLGCDPASSEAVLTPEQCKQIEAILAVYRASGKANANVERWIAQLGPKLCPGIVIPTPAPTPKPTATPAH